MTSEAYDAREQAAATAALVRAFVDLVEGEEPRGLDLLKRFRLVLADTYAAMLRLPPCGVAPARTVPLSSEDPDALEAKATDALKGRLPPELYWSALLPLTWASVGAVGVERLSAMLAESYSRLKGSVVEFDLGATPAEMFDSWETALIFFARPLLQALAVLHEVVTDLEMYERG